MRAGKTLVVSLNPAIDCEWVVPEVRWEEKNNIVAERRWAGGKGSNVTRWLRHLGGRPELLIPLGAAAGEELAGYLKQARVPTRVVRVKGDTRVNVIVTSDSGQIRFNPLGPVISQQEWRALLSQLRTFCRQEKKASGRPMVVLSGALPRGVPATAYARMINIAREFGVEACLDCDGAAFAEGIKAKPFLVKPNVHELAQWWKNPVKSRGELKAAVTELSATTGGWVLLSQGSEGALLWSSTAKSGFAAKAPKVRVRNTVGAGDALLAGFLRQIEITDSPDEWLRHGVAAGTACVQNKGGELANLQVLRKLAARVEVRPLEW
jgi:1-phosphofructokinase family hexose kinase